MTGVEHVQVEIRNMVVSQPPWLQYLAWTCRAEAIEAASALCKSPIGPETARAIVIDPLGSGGQAMWRAAALAWERATGILKEGSVPLTSHLASELAFLLTAGDPGEQKGRFRDSACKQAFDRALVDASSGPGGALTACHFANAVLAVRPFTSGNERLARLGFALVAADGWSTIPEVAALDSWFADHLSTYRELLAPGIAKGSGKRAGGLQRVWLRAYSERLGHVLERCLDLERKYLVCQGIVGANRLPGRCLDALMRAAAGDALSNEAHRGRHAVSAPTAHSDFRRLKDLGWLIESGQGPSTTYAASATLNRACNQVPATSDAD